MHEKLFDANDIVQCWSSSAVYKISPYDDNSAEWTINCTEIELVNECHLAFAQKMTNKTCSEYSTLSRKQPSWSQSKIIISKISFVIEQFHTLEYGYGFLSVFIISALSLAGFIAFPLMKKPYYKYLNAFFTALAVGTLFADSAFELFPVVCIYFILKNSNLISFY